MITEEEYLENLVGVKHWAKFQWQIDMCERALMEHDRLKFLEGKEVLSFMSAAEARNKGEEG
ncbi:MAG: hypothetical protein J5525_12525 [Lachnospiraceae bacterium]|nr:hypothetical protein [Lachnospiraceae bacterium]